MQNILKWRHQIVGVLVIALATTNAFAQGTPAGTWKTVDDVTGQPKGEVKIVEEDGVYSGTLIDVLKQDERNRICTQCTGDQKDKPIVGLTILRNMKATGDNEWSGGTILDPGSGKVYSARISLADGGAKLNVRGFVGVSLLGRTQTWIRE